jgi:hypothetical protein
MQKQYCHIMKRYDMNKISSLCSSLRVIKLHYVKE